MTDDGGLATLEEPLTEFTVALDERLATLDLDVVLGGLLDRVRERLAVDTAAVLLADPSSTYLMARAARGLEAEVHQGVRVPVGRGFAGRVAATREPVVIVDLAGSDVLNRLLRASGICSLLGVPLLQGDRLLGVLHVGTLRPHPFTEAEVRLLGRIAERVAVAVALFSSLAQRTAASTLQRELWPSDLPDVPGLELAARYAPAGDGEIAGDWYDVFTVPTGATWVVIGDVVGRGVPAALSMGRLRSALRAYAMDAKGPADLLRRLSRHAQHFDAGLMATVLCAVAEPGGGRLVVSSAGHPPPMLAPAGGPARLLGLPVDPPIGVGPTRTRHATTVEMAPGTTVCLYTDGLVERRGESLAEGLERLRRLVTSGPAEVVCMEVMAGQIGDRVMPDDVALLVLHRADSGRPPPFSLRAAAVPAVLQPAREAIRGWLAAYGAPREFCDDLVLAVSEAVTNSVEHAYGASGGDVLVEIDEDGADLVATVTDSGRWRAARGRFRGRGLTMMRALADELSVRREATGTTVMIRMSRPGVPR